MTRAIRHTLTSLGLFTGILLFLIVGSANAQQPRATTMLVKSETVRITNRAARTTDGESNEHPLVLFIERGRKVLQHLEGISNYSCVLVKRERVRGRLEPHQQIYVKLRHEEIRNGRVQTPFGIYAKFLGPADLRGRELVYVRGKNKNQIIARRGGQRFAYVTTTVDPNSKLAMEQSRFPITEMGIREMIRMTVVQAEKELAFPECEVKFARGAKVDGRRCDVYQVKHPIERTDFEFHIVRIFIDDQLEFPLRFEAYDWPDEKSGKPRLMEEYTVTKLRVNSGLTDWDFNHRNPAYKFRKNFTP